MYDRTEGEWDCANYRCHEMDRDRREDAANGTDTCTGCGEDRSECRCERETSTSKVVTARKFRKGGIIAERNEIRVGDRVKVTSGFSYEPDGPRTGYFRSYRRISKGPAWATEVN